MVILPRALSIAMKLNDALSRVPWQDFEILVANRFRRHGWEVAHCGYGHAGSRTEREVDLHMRRDAELALVQCRHESLCRVDAGTVERLLATAAEESADQVIIVTSGELPEDARQLAQSRGATIVEGEAVREMLDDDLLDLPHVSQVAVPDTQRGIGDIISRGKVPRDRPRWALPLFVAALTILGLLAVYGATLAREGLEHPRPPQVDPATLGRGASAPPP
jgi:hypothetical protein